VAGAYGYIVEIPEPLQNLILSNVNLVDDGIAAFRVKDYAQSIKCLSRALDKDKTDWRARMFLSMSYYATGATFPAANHLRYLHEHCPDQLVREKSKIALDSLQQRLEAARRDQAAQRHYGAL
jgi:tetratricopeptide (TPR) repeat protein